jgi:AraC family transcriptional regulator
MNNEILIKNMVCPRCILAVENTLGKLKISFQKVVLGKVLLNNELEKTQKQHLEKELEKLGFAVLKDKDVQRIEKIKNIFYELMQLDEIPSGFNVSAYVKAHLPEDYSTLSNLFSSMEGITIEKFFIQLKIDKVKEWLFYQEMQLSEMAYKLAYSSVQHLSSQFKKTTGMTPSDYKKLKKESGWK